MKGNIIILLHGKMEINVIRANTGKQKILEDLLLPFGLIEGPSDSS